MQLKLYRYLTWGSLLMAVILLGGAGYLIVNRNTFANFTTAIVIYVLVAFVISTELIVPFATESVKPAAELL